MKRIFSFLLLSLFLVTTAHAEISPTDVKQIYAAGTAYTLTNASALLDFGTTDPTVTLNAPGTWLFFGRVVVSYNGATFAANRTATFKLRRTNNTAADLTGASSAHVTNIVTTSTYTETVVIPPVLYTTTNAGDVISLYGLVNTVPTAGSLDVSEAEIIAIRIF